MSSTKKKKEQLQFIPTHAILFDPCHPPQNFLMPCHPRQNLTHEPTVFSRFLLTLNTIDFFHPSLFRIYS